MENFAVKMDQMNKKVKKQGWWPTPAIGHLIRNSATD